jgi:uncharacterized damage-inducible protein DinB
MIQAIIKNLERGEALLQNISTEQYSDKSVAPYFSSIGAHMRHILDIFDCIFDGLATKEVNLAARKRNELVEIDIQAGLAYFQKVINTLKTLEDVDFNQIVAVKDDLGLGEVTVNYTLAAALIQAHSHAIHHFASLGYLINNLGIELPDEDFGYNPTTPREALLG